MVGRVETVTLATGTILPGCEELEITSSGVDGEYKVDVILPESPTGVSEVPEISPTKQSELEEHHPALAKTVCLIDCNSLSRIVPNSEPFLISNELFDGKMMVLIRTPDADNPKGVSDDASCSGIGKAATRISKLFAKNPHYFEFQFQIKFKKIPTGPLYFSYELEQSNNISSWTKTILKFLSSIIIKMSPSIHFSLGKNLDKGVDSADRREGKYESVCLSCPLEARMGHLIITKPGEEIPVLGTELHDVDKNVTKRRKMGSGSVDWNAEDTYTMCTWSANVDFLQWKTLNLPGMVSSFPLSTICGKQPFYVSIYEYSKMTAQECKKKKPTHYRKDLNVYTRVEISNFQHTEGGLVDELKIRPS